MQMQMQILKKKRIQYEIRDNRRKKRLTYGKFVQELLRSLYKYFYTLCQIVKLSLALKPLFTCS